MTKNKPTIALTGANGFLGSALTEHFSAMGWQVVALVRQPNNFAAKSNVRYESYDITRPVSDTLLKGVDYLVHAAYIKYDKAHPDALAKNLRGAKNLLEVSRKNKLKRNIFISTMSAHSEAISIYGKQKIAVEALFDSHNDTVLKCGLIIGNGGIVKEMAGFMKSKHVVPLVGSGLQPLQIVAISDLVQVIEAVITKSLSGIYVIATPRVYTYREFYQALAQQLGIKVAFVPLPYGLLQTVFRLAAALHLPLGVGEDNLKGLKMLRAMESGNNLQKIGISLMDLETALAQIH